jgi:hypothetical protein
VAQHVGQDKLGHHLAKNAHRAGQAVVAWQAVGQQGRDARPGGLQPLRLMALAQQGGQTDPAGPATPGNRPPGATVRPSRRWSCTSRSGAASLQQLGVQRVILFSNQNAHGSNLSKTLQAAARPSLYVRPPQKRFH